jgi:D-psicose/D-tagatose/L-ribulose 3-epimerase
MMSMQVGMNLLLWTVHPTVREHRALLEQIKAWGFDGVEFPIALCSDEEIRELAKLCDDLGLARTAVQGFNAAVADPTSSDPKLRQGAIDELKRGIDKAAALGCEILAGPMFQAQGRVFVEAPSQDDWRRSVEVIRIGAQHAAARHMRLALEPLYRFEMSLVNTQADGSRFCRETEMPNVGLLADTHHSNIEETDVCAAWRAAAPHIFHVHISENDRGIPGRGHAIGPEIFQTLHETGYDGWLTIEAFSGKVKELVQRFRLWRQYFDREEDVAIEGLKFIRESWKRASS